ncbi:family S53 protease [Mycena albidolilacea]|uniref:Family S53 protease n=1 Tax=Mycena albidolilacea TaxID=1033008 RepID=A0AAD7EDQ7_9AGAR|nr:family S53 protease [Mycena albidolilacea]
MLIIVAALVPLLVGVASEFVVLERRDGPPPGFSSIGPTPGSEVLTLRFGLSSNNIPALHETVYDISTPGNALYGKYLSQEEINKFVAPSADTLSRVSSWLSGSNFTSVPVTPAGDWISVNMTVAQANDLLAADFSTFQDRTINATVIRTLCYAIPSNLQGHIDWVHPTVKFPVTRTRAASFVNRTSAKPPTSLASISADCRVSSSWTPACLQELYGIPSTPAKPAANVLGVSGFNNDFANKRDLKTFLQLHRPDINPNTTFDLITLDGGLNNQLPQNAGNTGDPDTQYTVGLATGVPVTYISTGTLPNDLLTEMLDQANFLLKLENPPQTILNSNSDTSIGLESVVSPAMGISLCNAYAQLAARGVSYIVQTGIWGAGGTPFGLCKPFDPPFPASCPFVTAVGGTFFDNDEPEETGAFISGGGFSTFFGRPRYQDAAVSAYLQATNNTQATAFNVSGRAVPDVSAIAQISYISDGAIIDGASATEFSADIFASIIALLTNERIVAGKPGLGFLNPLIYANPGAFNDITTGSNPGCNTPGFNATGGWDPVTGFGSPSYPKLQKLCAVL